MSISSGFFDSVNGDRTYDADQMSTYFEGLISDGVYENIGDKFLVTVNNGLTINVGSGRAIIQSHWVKNDATTALTLDPADVQYGRVDAIVLRLDATARSITLAIKKGTPSSSPTMPAITRTQTVYELYIASVYLSKNATQPTTITDLRPSSYCGWVTGIIKQVDTSQLFLQWQSAYEQQFAAFDAYITAKQTAFDAWFKTLTSQLTVDTTITKYQSTVIPGDGASGALINIDEYNKNTDVLFVYVNGVYFVEGLDYTIATTGYGQSGIALTGERTFRANDKVTFIVLANVPGGSVLAPANAMAIGNAFASGFVTNTEPVEEES